MPTAELVCQDCLASQRKIEYIRERNDELEQINNELVEKCKILNHQNLQYENRIIELEKESAIINTNATVAVEIEELNEELNNLQDQFINMALSTNQQVRERQISRHNDMQAQIEAAQRARLSRNQHH
ncbi:hypothetical protein PCE1_004946 [Barthelona sp. PCE]